MGLQQLNGSYDAIFSLGDLCLASLQLRRMGLRPYAGVVDWMATPSLQDVNRLLENRFKGFMEYQNLVVRGMATIDMLLVEDTKYHFMSNHDFSTQLNTMTNLVTYPEVKAKFNRRIERFLEKMKTSKNILFVRTEADFGEVVQLEEVLSDFVANDFHILVINHTSVSGIVEKNWPLANTTAIELPNYNKWTNNDHLWDEIFSNVILDQNL